MARTIKAHLVRRGTPEEKAFDRVFWKEAGHEAIFAAAWEMVAERANFRGGDLSESRLQRSVGHIKRRAC